MWKILVEIERFLCLMLRGSKSRADFCRILIEMFSEFFGVTSSFSLLTLLRDDTSGMHL